MQINYEQIRKANETVRTTNISGKEYAEVNQRIKAFRMVYPLGFIQTEIKSNEGGVVVFIARVGFLDEQNQPHILGVGHAYERENSTFINKTSYIENCETSAVGRALGMCGFGIDTSVCSAEELQNAKLNQDKPAPKATTPKSENKPKTTTEQAQVSDQLAVPQDKEMCVMALEALGTDINKVLTAYKFKSIDEMPLEKLQEAYKRKKLSQSKGAN